jgi:hypothetical protein
MPITQKDDQQALDWLVNNPTDNRASAVMDKLGVGPDEVQAWKWSKSNLVDPRVIEVRNKVFDTIANSRPSVDEMPSGAVMDRMVIKNLLDAEPDLQAEYLKKKGYDVRWVYKEEKLKPARLGAGKAGGYGSEVDQQPRLVKEQVLELKRPGDNKWGVIDPKSVLDLWDVTDVIGDAVEAAAGALASGSKPFGPIGILAGGAATAGVEAGKQGIAKAIGAREELNPSRIVQAGLTGMAVPALVGLTGKAIKLGGSVINKGMGLLGITPKAEAGAIEESAKLLGAKATPGQLSGSKLVQDIESTQYQSTGQIGGFFTRRQIAENRKAVQKEADALVKEAVNRTEFNLGDEAGNKIIQELEKRLEPVEAIYDKYETMFKSIPKSTPYIKAQYKPDTSSILNKITKLKEDFSADDFSINYLNKIEEKIKNIDTLSQLKTTRTWVSKGTKPSEPNSYYIAGEIRDLLTEARTDTLKNLAKISSGGNQNEFKKMAEEIGNADFEYRAIIDDVKNIMGVTKERLPRGPVKSVEKFIKDTPEISLINKTIKEGDPRKIAQIKNSFPESFDLLRQGKITEIAKRSEADGKVNPSKLSSILNDLPPETRDLLFDNDAVLKIKALKIYLDSIPEKVGPSGTPGGLNVFNMLSPRVQLWGLGRSALQQIITSPNAANKIGQLIEMPVTKAYGIFETKQFLDNEGLKKPQESGLKVPGRK